MLSNTEVQVENDVSRDDASPPKRKKLGNWLESARQEQESGSLPEQAVKGEIEQYCKIIQYSTTMVATASNCLYYCSKISKDMFKPVCIWLCFRKTV